MSWIPAENRQANLTYIEPLESLVSKIKPKRGLEVGFGDYGWSAMAFLDSCDGTIISIDKEDWHGNAANLAHQNKRFTFVKGYSEVELQKLIDKKATFDYIFIDGDHSYEGCRKDLELATRLLDKNGVIAIDDIGVSSGAVDVIGPGTPVEGEFGVARAVEEVLSGWKEVLLEQPLANGGKVYKRQ